MRLETPRRAIALVIVFGASGSAVAACGSDEVFVPQLGSNERLIAPEAVARLGLDDQDLESLTIVGDLDGDGIDDAVVSTFYVTPPRPDHSFDFGGSAYVLYGGSAVAGTIDISTLPTLTDISGLGGGGIIAVGDVDGDGLADFLATVDRTPGCGNPLFPTDKVNSGAYLVYGSTTRLTGTRRIADAGAFLRDPTPCTTMDNVAALGDLDGDGKADFAIRYNDSNSSPIQNLVFYGRGERFAGTVDVTSTADAVISVGRLRRVGDVDGDGHGDFLLAQDLTVSDHIDLVRGGAARLSGTVALGDLAHSRFVVDAPCDPLVGDARLGDLDGDGVDDFSLLCGPALTNYPAPVQVVHHVFYGRSGGFPAQVGLTEADATLQTSSASVSSPSLIAAADVDGDGVRDLIMTDAGLHNGNGGVHVIRGNGVRLSGSVDLGVRSTTYVGAPVRDPDCRVPGSDCTLPESVGEDLAVGDLTGDHRADILVGAPVLLEAAVLGVHGSSMYHAYVVSPAADPKP